MKRIILSSSYLFFCVTLAPQSDAIDITITYESVGQEPDADPNGDKLVALAEYVASVYEDIIEDNHAMEFKIRYDIVTFTNGQFSHLQPNNATNRSTQGRVTINPTPANSPDRKFYYDPTPADDSEYDMQQWLFRDLTNSQQAERFNGNTPAVFEAGYRGEVAANAPDDAQDATDMLTILFHEMGHGLGLNSNLRDLFNSNGPNDDETDDGDFDVNPSLVNGNFMALNVRGTGSGDSRSHVFGSDDFNFAVMSSNSRNVRRRPSATDLLAMASISGWNEIDLRRQDFLGGGDWNTGFNWLGGQVPLSFDAASVRHGNSVTLSGNGGVDSLLIDNGSSVDTLSFRLVADEVDIQKTFGSGTPRIIIGSQGELRSNRVNVGEGTRFDLIGGDADVVNELSINENAELRGFGTINVIGAFGELTNDGVIAATTGNTLTFLSVNNLGFDLDGNNEDGVIESN